MPTISYKIKSRSFPELFASIVASACFLYALYIAVRYAKQVPLDGLYPFRQTQTALTTYWFVKNGFSFAYETPVAGPPWSIPFEFPIYQYVVALGSRIFGSSLDATARIVSFVFLALCILPARAIVRNLGLSRSVFPIFVALLISSPFYLYWGRTFMIETAALFFTVAGLKYFIDIIQSGDSYLHGLLFVLFITLGILQKATTGLPILAMTCLIYAYVSLKESSSLKEIVFGKKLVAALIYFGIPLAVGVAWTWYTDDVKMLNELGTSLTSNALGKWNWGSFEQRFSYALYHDVIWRRIFRDNLCGLLGVAILLAALFSRGDKKVKIIVVVALAMGVLPLFLFTNLHLVHTYYQSSCMIFFIFALAVSIGHLRDGNYLKGMGPFLLTLILVAVNLNRFSHDYLGTVKTVYSGDNSPEYAISQIIKKEVPADKSFVAFGNDWNSSLSYLSERKSFTVPAWLKQYDKIALHPENSVNEKDLGAVVRCAFSPISSPTIHDLIRWSSNGRHWKVGETGQCYIATPEIDLGPAQSNAADGDCRASIELAGDKQVANETISVVLGSVLIGTTKESATNKVYISLTKNAEAPIYLEAQQFRRPNVDHTMDPPNTIDHGFSRVLSENLADGEYAVGVATAIGGHLETCQMQTKVSATASPQILHVHAAPITPGHL